MFPHLCTTGLILRAPTFHTFPPPVRSASRSPRDSATRDHPSQGHGSSPAAFHQMPRCTADGRASIVPGHLSSPFRQSFDAELLAVPAPERGLAAGASSSSTLCTGCSSWSTGCINWFLFLLVGVVLNRGLQIAGIVRCVGGSRWCTVAACSPRRCVCRLGLLVCSSAGGPSCHLPSASVDLSLRRRGWVRSFQRGHGGHH